MEERAGGQMSERGEKGKDGAGWIEEGGSTGPSSTAHIPPVLHWMTSTHTARHHDGHSPPLMSPSHS